MKLSGTLVVLSLVACLGCSSDDGTPPQLGDQCSEGEEPYLCVEGKLSSQCGSPEHCSGASECRNVDGVFACVDIKWGFGPGQYPTSCAVGGQWDCDEAGGFVCLGADSPYAYCSGTCSSDRECPPNYACRDTAVGSRQAGPAKGERQEVDKQTYWRIE